MALETRSSLCYHATLHSLAGPVKNLVNILWKLHFTLLGSFSYIFNTYASGIMIGYNSAKCIIYVDNTSEEKASTVALVFSNFFKDRQ